MSPAYISAVIELKNKFKRSIKRRLHLRRSTIIDPHKLPNAKLMALVRHDAHRIEKSIYNNILLNKLPTYEQKRRDILDIIEILASRGVSRSEPTLSWAEKICHHFTTLKTDFIEPNSAASPPINQAEIPQFLSFLRSRRSVRVWHEEQPSGSEYKTFAHQLIDSARWAPTSGNRQPWRFKILTEKPDKQLLSGIKENHCTSAPLLIFIGMDSRVYGAFGSNERSLYIDAGAAIMSMILTAHRAGFGTCWNHFADDLICTRNNAEIYRRFCKEKSIPDHVTPVAILAVGRSAFIPPTPTRMNIETLILPD